MDEYVFVNILGRPVTWYALSIWLGCLGGAALFLYEGRALKKNALWGTLILGTVLGLFCARAYYVLARFELFNEIGWNHFFTTEDEYLKSWGAANGAAFWGAVGGVCLGALASAKLTGEKASALLDALAPSAALAIGISRFGEYSIGEGIGPDVEAEELFFFPMAVVNEWDEWKFAVFMLEGIAAAVIFLLLMTRGRKLKDGYRARMFLIYYSSAQIILEALRRDNFLRWLFVRVSQVASAVVLLGLIVFAVIRWTRIPRAKRMPTKKLILCCTLFAAMIGAIVALEFAVDKSPYISMGVAYLLEAACCGVIGICTWQVVMKH